MISYHSDRAAYTRRHISKYIGQIRPKIQSNSSVYKWQSPTRSQSKWSASIVTIFRLCCLFVRAHCICQRDNLHILHTEYDASAEQTVLGRITYGEENATDPPKWLKYIAFLTYCLALAELWTAHPHILAYPHESFAISGIMHIALRGNDAVRCTCRMSMCSHRPHVQCPTMHARLGYLLCRLRPLHTHTQNTIYTICDMDRSPFRWITFEIVFVRSQRNEYSAFVKYVRD